ncbi:MAG: DUF2461 domain-containing protein [Bacteroidales bacterium]|jgi:uncharacterized protein (TIGR02453 family)|nr:DUF2461 domain-containing protein [Bacteroidales bacterium]
MATIQKSTIQFLSDLKLHNDKEWFNANRKRYESARSDFETFVQAAIDEISLFDPILKGLESKSCTYRINRDIRFSNDKTIYKTHLGAFVVRGGKRNGDRFAGYYIHVEPGNSMIAGGAYMPPSAWLSAIREKIAEHGKEFLKITSDPDFIRFFGAIEGEKLKSAPKGYSRDHPHIELLKLKSFLSARQISDSKMTSESCLEYIVSACRAMKPLNDFLNNCST